MHLKRNNLKKFWPIPKKGTKYIALPNHNKNTSIPLIIAIRDILKLVKNKKELKEVLKQKSILINSKIIYECNYPLCLFDVITLQKQKKNYKVMLSKSKKIELVPIDYCESKPYKVLGKKILKKNKVQLNLSEGLNIISSEKVNIGDSVLVSFKDKKITKVLECKEGKSAFVLSGKHMGLIGKIESIVERGNKKIAKIKSENKKANVWTKNIIIIE